jgi:hypothetical protein
VLAIGEAELTLNELYTRVRRVIKDRGTPPRHGNADLLDYSNLTQDMLWTDHPEAFMEDGIPTDRPTELTSADNTRDLPITRDFEQPFVHHVAYLVLMEDSEIQSNQGLAEYHYAQYIRTAT